MRTEPGEAHRVTDLVAPKSEGQLALERGDKEAWGIDDAAVPLPLSLFTSEPDSRSDRIYVGPHEGESFRYTRTQLLHYDDGEPIARVHTFKNGDDTIFVGWLGLSPEYAWKLDASVASNVDRDIGEVEHHPQLRDEQPDGPWFVLRRKLADPFYDVADADLVDWSRSEDVEEDGSAGTITGARSVRYVPPAGEPFVVHLSELGVADNGSLELALWIFRGGEIISYQVSTDHRLPPGPERTSVLYLGIPAAPAVADVEPAAVPGVPGSDVEGRQ